MVQQFRIAVGYGVDRLQQDPRVLSEEGTDPVQHVGPGKAFPRQVTVELRPVDPEVAAKSRNRRKI
ncbi:hypothetical protein GCM10011360_13890 [Primorskyibacter flagellatus]|uniref:Uncharacterized protein n=1 Tax=Primorskyibacter flagellatus TaxID=1387277 RepID=A0A917A6Q5_9RHOB|nr:hypothetical protein GCM10011360_13890 [Primorskyibacter flagellatus]